MGCAYISALSHTVPASTTTEKYRPSGDRTVHQERLRKWSSSSQDVRVHGISVASHRLRLCKDVAEATSRTTKSYGCAVLLGVT